MIAEDILSKVSARHNDSGNAFDGIIMHYTVYTIQYIACITHLHNIVHYAECTMYMMHVFMYCQVIYYVIFIILLLYGCVCINI